MEKGRKRKIDEENRLFNESWTYLYAVTVDNSCLPLCLLCGQKFSNNKKSNVERHFQRCHSAEKYAVGDNRKRAVLELLHEIDERKSTFQKWVKLSNSSVTASFMVAQEIAKHGKPFTDGEFMKESFLKISKHLFSDFKNKSEIFQKIKDIPLSAKTIKDRTLKMSTDITNQQIKDINSVSAYSIACDESRDVSDVERLVLICKYVSSVGPQEEILDLIPLKGYTRGEDICEAVLECLRSKGMNTNNLVSVATDGAPSMIGVNKGFVALLQKSLDRELLTFHCILHQEVLCAQMIPPECTEVMNLVIRIVNKIMVRGINHQHFRLLLDEVNSTYSDLLLYNKVRWLSRGEVLKRFTTCLEHIITFLESKGITFPELKQPVWLEKLHFMVDMTSHLCTLNKNLQGKGCTALQMFEEVLAFERKMTVFSKDIQRRTLYHFPSLTEFRQEHSQINYNYLHRAITEMQSAFGKRFSDFRKERNTLAFPVTPLDVDPSSLNMTAFTSVSQQDLEIELADTADKDIWMSKFRRLITDLEDVARQKAILAENHKWKDVENLPRPDEIIFKVWNTIPDTYKNMKKYAFGVLSIFGSTYLCEQIFSTMNFIKNKYRSHLSDDCITACMKLKVTSYSPDIEKLCNDVQKQKSH